MPMYIGLMSGTSADGIDAALVDFNQSRTQMISHLYHPYPSHLREEILALCQPGDNEIERLGELDIRLGQAFAKAVNELLAQEGLKANHIQAIGSHGQTIRHAPNHRSRFTLQIGDPNTIAAHTGITTVADFRRKDMALGGQGAPLVPAFHHHMLASANQHRAVINIGGIANVTFLIKNKLDQVLGFDTGPGNVLMDEWIYAEQNQHYDDGGKWAASGEVDDELLKLFLSEAFFHKAPPKSTGREYFNLRWIQRALDKMNKKLAAKDIQATLLELTALSISNTIKTQMPDGEIIVCGGGVKNKKLLERLQNLVKAKFSLVTTAKYGILPDWVEAIAFAWLAFRTLNKLTGNMPSVTGAKQSSILGAIYYP